MKLHDIPNNETRRPSISEKELSRLKELIAAPKEISSSADESRKEKLMEAKSIISERLEQQKEMPKPAPETKDDCEKTQIKHKIEDSSPEALLKKLDETSGQDGKHFSLGAKEIAENTELPDLKLASERVELKGRWITTTQRKCWAAGFPGQDGFKYLS